MCTLNWKIIQKINLSVFTVAVYFVDCVHRKAKSASCLTKDENGSFCEASFTAMNQAEQLKRHQGDELALELKGPGGLWFSSSAKCRRTRFPRAGGEEWGLCF